MSNAFHKFRYHTPKLRQESHSFAAAPVYRGESGENDEAVARRYLSDAFQSDGREAMRGIVAPERAGVVPDLKLTSSHTLKSGGRVLRFEQMQQNRPIFGTAATVEMIADQTPVSASGSVAQVEGVSAWPNLSELQALQKIADATGKNTVDLEKAIPEAPHLYYFRTDDEDRWHLAYLFKNVPAVLKKAERVTKSGFDESPRDTDLLANYLVDAHNGAILFSYGAAPTMGVSNVTSVPKSPPPPIPASLKGIDEFGTQQIIFGNKIGQPIGWELYDVDRSIKTYDLQFQNMVTASLPAGCVQYGKPLFDQHAAAVSAHLNASRVYKFYKGEMNRNGIDNKGMDLISVVNCTYGASAPVWLNAMWWNDRMWYGQRYGEDQKTLHSYSQFLDVIAHELTHGVTKTTADLVYQGQSGALNESISDIFGVIINNWYMFEAVQAKRDDVSNWNWKIGDGIGKDGGPLRDFSNPALTGDPDHMSKFVVTENDFGGVHVNSGIHNKAAYNFLSAKDAAGKQVFLPEEVAHIYYQTLLHLNPMAQFLDILTTIVDVAETYYADPDEKDVKTAAIRKAYADTGIKE